MGTWNDVHTLPVQYRMKAHCPGLKGAPGTANQWICYEFICICSASVTALKGKLEKTKLWHKHRDQWEKVYKLTESLKNVIHILGNVIQGLGHSWAPVKTTMHKRRILSGSKWSVWRGLTLKQFLGKWTYGQALDTFPLKNKSFSTKLFS